MKNIFKIIRADLRHIKTNVIALCVIIGLTVIPALYSWFNILSNWDPYGQASTSRIKVAVVSVDKGTSLEGTELNVGDNIITLSVGSLSLRLMKQSKAYTAVSIMQPSLFQRIFPRIL